MRFALLTAFALVLTAGAAEAVPPPESYLRVDNNCDDALRVEVRGVSPDTTRERVTLEPNSSVLIPVEVIPDNPVSLEVQARLGKSRATETCTVNSGETTVAGVYCEPSGRHVNLYIVCETPTLAAFIREAGVLTASTGGLAAMIFLSSLLGRARRRRENAVEQSPAASGDAKS